MTIQPSTDCHHCGRRLHRLDRLGLCADCTNRLVARDRSAAAWREYTPERAAAADRRDREGRS